jgi:DtxR family manganese transport transcriptional regulator
MSHFIPGNRTLRPNSTASQGRTPRASSKRRHDIVYSALLALGVNEEQARIDAEGIEHHVGKETLEAFQRLLDKRAR